MYMYARAFVFETAHVYRDTTCVWVGRGVWMSGLAIYFMYYFSDEFWKVG